MSDVQETAEYPRTYENYNSTLKHKLPLRVTFEMPNRMEQAKFSDGSLGCCYYESEMSRYQGWKLVEPHFDLSTLDTAGVFHHSQQPAPVETSATPSQPADVPQWCRDAAREWLSKLVCFSDKNDLIQMLGRHIARHANTNKTEEISPLVSLANVVEREKKDVGTNDRLLDFSNLEALIQGCVSGRVSEWPFLKTEAYRALQLIKNQSAEIERLKAACSAQQNEIQQIIGKALGYPRYCDDQANFPNATEADGVCVGEHVAESLASEAAAQIASLRERLAGVEDERDRAQSACCELRQAFKSSVDGKRSLYDMMEYEVDRVGSSLGPLQDGSWRKVILACWPYIEAANSTTCGDETWRKLKDLTARLSAAEAERDELEQSCKLATDTGNRLLDERDALRADLARAKEDGERMRQAVAGMARYCANIQDYKTAHALGQLAGMSPTPLEHEDEDIQRRKRLAESLHL